MKKVQPYKAKNKIRILTAGSLFDGHDAAINIMRRIIQRSGAEVIHLGHNRPVHDIVNAAIQEDVQGIAITSYQGGHNEFFKYAFDLLKEKGAGHIKLFGGGGGTILPTEIKELEAYGIARIYSPDDGRAMGLQGMINDLLEQCDYPIGEDLNGQLARVEGAASPPPKGEHPPTMHASISEVGRAGGRPPLGAGGEGRQMHIARLISAVENYPEQNKEWLDDLKKKTAESTTPVLGITGTGGAGKSSLVDELVLRFLAKFKDKTLAIISVDPSKRKTGGALLGDRIRMNSIADERVFMRSLATRQYNLALSKHIDSAIVILKHAGFDLIILETSGIGQSGSEIVDHADLSVYVMTPEFGAASQLEKIDMLDYADVVAINKFDKMGALDALRDVKKQYQRNHDLWDTPPAEMPVFGSIASQFNDPGVNALFNGLMERLFKGEYTDELKEGESQKQFIIPPARVRYLSEISENNRRYDQRTEEQSELARKVFSIENTIEHLKVSDVLEASDTVALLEKAKAELLEGLTKENKKILENWEAKKVAYRADEFVYKVRNKEIKIENFTLSLSQNKIPKIALPKFKDWGEILRWCKQENVPGEFPFTAGVFPFKRKGEDPTRMFAGEGGPERTNKRFHYLSKGMPAKRLSTAFDSVTLYGEDPDLRPDIYGKVGNSGVNVSSLNDAKKLYSGFDLCNPKTSVSMTINGPAATICAYFMNAAIDQQCELYIKEKGLENLVEAKFKEVYDDRGLERPRYSPPKPPQEGGGKGVTSHLGNLEAGDTAFSSSIGGSHDEGSGDLTSHVHHDSKTRKPSITPPPNKDSKNPSTVLSSPLGGGREGSPPQPPQEGGGKGVTSHLDKLNRGDTAFSSSILGRDDEEREILTSHVNDDSKTRKSSITPPPNKDSKNPSTVLSSPFGGGREGALGLMLLGLTGDQILEPTIYNELKDKALRAVRGTVQADILKEDQAQNTCIFSTEFSLKLMGDMQEYFIENGVRNFYSVSISGYHIAEAGANPISQLAFTLSNGFTFVEYYLSRGMKIDDFAPNLSFFFSNGLDPEYAVIGRVARRIWAKAMKYKYGANERSQKLKYHIQTSGRSLHAQEIDFNDIRTTLQALYAIYDNCNSLHTNAYDEAITTPTEESVRRAVAIQMIINHELGLAKNENPLQGAFIIEELTDLVEEAILSEFDRITERGGVLGAMETMYQRSKIQEESLYYETLKHTGEFPIIGVNTFLSSTGSPTIIPEEVIRSTEEEKEIQIHNLQELHKVHAGRSGAALEKLKEVALRNGNVFEELMEAGKCCSLGQITNALFGVGGRYRRSM